MFGLRRLDLLVVHAHRIAAPDEAALAPAVRYLNCGDWVESCTAIVEHADGRFEIIDWSGGPRLASPVVQSPRTAPARDVEVAA